MNTITKDRKVKSLERRKKKRRNTFRRFSVLWSPFLYDITMHYYYYHERTFVLKYTIVGCKKKKRRNSNSRPPPPLTYGGGGYHKYTRACVFVFAFLWLLMICLGWVPRREAGVFQSAFSPLSGISGLSV